MSKRSRSLCMSLDTRVDHFNITENLPMAQILQSAASRWQMPVFERLTNSKGPIFSEKDWYYLQAQTDTVKLQAVACLG